MHKFAHYYQQLNAPGVERLEAVEAFANVFEHTNQHLDGGVRTILLEPAHVTNGGHICL